MHVTGESRNDAHHVLIGSAIQSNRSLKRASRQSGGGAMIEWNSAWKSDPALGVISVEERPTPNH
jgi:hypothetical protein